MTSSTAHDRELHAWTTQDTGYLLFGNAMLAGLVYILVASVQTITSLVGGTGGRWWAPFAFGRIPTLSALSACVVFSVVITPLVVRRNHRWSRIRQREHWESQGLTGEPIRFPCFHCRRALSADPSMSLVICPVCTSENAVPTRTALPGEVAPVRLVGVDLPFMAVLKVSLKLALVVGLGLVAIALLVVLLRPFLAQ
jgi:hypothetical protein